MFKVGLTGGIGSGKSIVARVFGVLGIPVFVSDDAGKHLLQEDPELRAKVSALFGQHIYSNGILDRKALAEKVFHDEAALAGLNAIVHPAVRGAFEQWATEQTTPYVLNEAAVLIESGGYKTMDHLVVVSAPERERIARVMKRDNVTEAQVVARMRNQLSEETRLAKAGSVIVNDGVQLVIPQVLALHAQFLELAN